MDRTRGARSAALLALTLALTSSLATGALAQDEETNRADDPATIVVTTEVLGSIVDDLVGDGANVEVLMDGGVDPHSWQPSARDGQAVFEADLVVANGLGLEEGLTSILEEAAAQGVLVFTATDQNIEAGPASDPPSDPHFWLDPVAMGNVVTSLAVKLGEAGIDTTERVATVSAALDALDAEIHAAVESIPEERRRLVTGHDALSYYADRYGFEVIGTVVPGVSSSGEASARDLAVLIEAIKSAGATVVFTDVGTPQSVAAAVASDAGASIVELEVAVIPDGGSYADLLRSITSAIVGALAPTD